MSRADLKLTGQLLQTQVDALVRQARALAPAIALVGAKVRSAPFAVSPPAKVTVKVLDDGNPWAHAVDATTMAVGAKTIRGMMMGALREGVAGTSMAGMLFELGGNRTFDDGGKDETFDAEASEQVLKLQLDIVEHGRAQGLMSAVFEGVRERGDLGEDEAPLRDVADDYISGRRKTPLTTAMGLTSSFEGLVALYKPAERFVLAHEIGHMALGHAEALRSATTCADLTRIEDEADTFAITLLALSPTPGDEELLTRMDFDAFSRTIDTWLGDETPRDDAKPFSAPDEDPAQVMAGLTLDGYGYSLLVGKALAYMGLVVPPGQECQPRTAEQRLAFLRDVHRAAQSVRWSALGRVVAYERAHPPSVSERHSFTFNGRYVKLTAAEEEEMRVKLTAACHSAAPGPMRRRRAVVESRPGGSFDDDDRVETVYSVACKAPSVTLQLSAEDKAVLGPSLIKRFDDAYAGRR